MGPDRTRVSMLLFVFVVVFVSVVCIVVHSRLIVEGLEASTVALVVGLALRRWKKSWFLIEAGY